MAIRKAFEAIQVDEDEFYTPRLAFNQSDKPNVLHPIQDITEPKAVLPGYFHIQDKPQEDKPQYQHVCHPHFHCAY